jgi:hypothetical protein
MLNAAVAMGVAKLERKVEGWTGKVNGGGKVNGDAGADDESSGDVSPLADAALDQLGEGGAAKKAGAEGVKASLHGNNPILAAIKGAWESGTPVMRAAIITAGVAAIVLALVSPVLLIVFLLSLLVTASAHRAAQSRQSNAAQSRQSKPDQD